MAGSSAVARALVEYDPRPAEQRLRSLGLELARLLNDVL
jgi:hypothetical protein